MNGKGYLFIIMADGVHRFELPDYYEKSLIKSYDFLDNEYSFDDAEVTIPYNGEEWAKFDTTVNEIVITYMNVGFNDDATFVYVADASLVSAGDTLVIEGEIWDIQNVNGNKLLISRHNKGAFKKALFTTNEKPIVAFIDKHSTPIGLTAYIGHIVSSGSGDVIYFDTMPFLIEAVTLVNDSSLTINLTSALSYLGDDITIKEGNATLEYHYTSVYKLLKIIYQQLVDLPMFSYASNGATFYSYPHDLFFYYSFKSELFKTGSDGKATITINPSDHLKNILTIMNGFLIPKTAQITINGTVYNTTQLRVLYNRGFSEFDITHTKSLLEWLDLDGGLEVNIENLNRVIKASYNGKEKTFVAGSSGLSYGVKEVSIDLSDIDLSEPKLEDALENAILYGGFYRGHLTIDMGIVEDVSAYNFWDTTNKPLVGGWYYLDEFFTGGGNGEPLLDNLQVTSNDLIAFCYALTDDGQAKFLLMPNIRVNFLAPSFYGVVGAGATEITLLDTEPLPAIWATTEDTLQDAYNFLSYNEYVFYEPDESIDVYRANDYFCIDEDILIMNVNGNTLELDRAINGASDGDIVMVSYVYEGQANTKQLGHTYTERGVL